MITAETSDFGGCPAFSSEGLYRCRLTRPALKSCQVYHCPCKCLEAATESFEPTAAGSSNITSIGYNCQYKTGPVASFTVLFG